MSFFHSAAVATVAALGVYGTLQLYGFVRDNDQQRRDPFHVMEVQANFSALASHLPAKAPIGYFSDMAESDDAGRAAFLASRYGVAPWLLTRGDAPQYLVGAFAQSQLAADAASQRNLEVMQGLGPGFVLFRKKGAK